MATSIDDINKSFQGFKEGIQTLKTNRALQRATDAVDQIRKEEGDGFVKSRKAIQDVQKIANSLSTDLLKFGNSANVAEKAAGFLDISLNRPFFQTADQVGINPDKASDDQLAFAKEQQDNKLELGRLKIQAAREKVDQSFGFRQDGAIDKTFTNLQKNIDNSAAVRNAMGRAGIQIQQIAAGKAVIPDKSKWDGVSAVQMREIVSVMSKTLTGGVPTKDQLEELTPNTANFSIARFKEWFHGAPVGTNSGAYVALFDKMLRREEAELNFEVEDVILNRASASAGSRSLFGANIKPEMRAENEERFRQLIINQMQSVGSDYSAPELSIKNGVVTTERRQQAIQGFQKAWPKVVRARSEWDKIQKAAKSGGKVDIKKVERLKEFFQKLRITPSENMQTIKSTLSALFRRGTFSR